MQFHPGSFDLTSSSEKQPSQQISHGATQIPFHHRRTSSSFSQSRPEDGSDVVNSHGSGYDSTLVAVPVIQDRHSMISPTATALTGTFSTTQDKSSPLLVGGRRKTPKPVDPATPSYYYKQLAPGQTFPVQRDGIPQYVSFWNSTVPPNTCLPPSASQSPRLMQGCLPASSSTSVAQELHPAFVQYLPLPLLRQPMRAFPPLPDRLLQAQQSAPSWDTHHAFDASGDSCWRSVTNGYTPQISAPRGASRQDHSIRQHPYANRFQRRGGQPQYPEGSLRGDVVWKPEKFCYQAPTCGNPDIGEGDANLRSASIPIDTSNRDETPSQSEQGLGRHPIPARPSNPFHCDDQARAKSSGSQCDTASSARAKMKKRTTQAQRRARALEIGVVPTKTSNTSKVKSHKLRKQHHPEDPTVHGAISIDWRSPLTPSKVTQRVTSERPGAEAGDSVGDGEGRRRSRSV